MKSDGAPGRPARARLAVAAARLTEGLNGLMRPTPALAFFFAFYLVSALFVVARYDFNPSALARFGNYYIEQNQTITPAGAIRLLGDETHGGNGYDGQIFYYYARTLFVPGGWPAGFNDAYRAPRVGYPLLAAPFVVFGSWGVLFGLILSQLALLALGLLLLLRMLPADRKYLALFYIVSPFSLQSFLLLVSDSVVAALLVIGYYFYRRTLGTANARTTPDAATPPVPNAGAQDGASPKDFALAWLCFALAVLTKESSLFLLFPLGLLALWRRRWPAAAIMVAVLLPMAAWQLYLRAAHGMIPAGVLSIFLSPLDGVIGLAGHTFELLGEFLAAPGGATALALVKHSVKVLLFLLIPAALLAVFSGDRKALLPFRLGALFTLASVLIADWYYFWSVYENVSRMLTVLVPILIFLKAEDARARTGWFFGLLGLLALLVFLRTAALTPRFPYDTFRPYTGPSHAEHALDPGDLHAD